LNVIFSLSEQNCLAYRKRYFDRTVAERWQLLHRGRFIFKKHLSGGRNYWHYGSASAVRSSVSSLGTGLRLHSQVTVLERLLGSHYQQILTAYEQQHCYLPRPV